ncbi:MAG: hypothetical protein ACMUEM_05935 [Flavobacteriales bacterium AspAUS03]
MVKQKLYSIELDKVRWEYSTPVISSVQKFIRSIAKFDDDRESSRYLADHEKVSQLITTDWQGKVIGDKGLFFSMTNTRHSKL